MAKEWARKFYNSRQWKNTRKQVLHRDRYTCNDCYGRAEEVHHIIELTPLNINDVMISLNTDNLISLCGNCHKRRTLGCCDIGDEYVFDDEGHVIKNGHVKRNAGDSA